MKTIRKNKLHIQRNLDDERSARHYVVSSMFLYD